MKMLLRQLPQRAPAEGDGVHFDVAAPSRIAGSVAAGGERSPDALEKLLAEIRRGRAMEPDVTRALATRESPSARQQDTNKLILDVLLVNRKFSQEKPEAVTTLLMEYFQVAKAYGKTRNA